MPFIFLFLIPSSLEYANFLIELIPSAGLTTKLTRLQPRAPDFLGAPKRPHKGLNEFGLMYVTCEILKISVQFYQI